MKIAIACDHRGYDGKKKLLPYLAKLGHDVHDFGCEGTSPVDYPEFALLAAESVAAGNEELGILLDGSGIGMSVAANKVRDVRAGVVHDEITAHRAREHNHCNVLCLGTDLLSEDQIRLIVEIFLNTPCGEGRHARRVAQLQDFENRARAKK
jgi:ribose 5-phosphate isomerase B